MLSGDNGILQKATDAKTLTERQSIIEQARTDVLGYQAENKGGDLDKTQLKSVLDTYFKDVPDLTDMSDIEIKEKQLETLPKYGIHTITVSEIYNGNLKGSTPLVTGNLNANEVAGLPNGVVEIAKKDVANTTIKNNTNVRAVITGEIPIPNGFYYVGGTKDDGVVISDNVADSGKGTSHSVAQTLQGNQFVWVPVDDATKFIRSDWENWSGSGEPSPINSDYVENSSYDPTGKYQEMYDSVTSNNGFFVARYEASQGANGYESKMGKNVWAGIQWGNSENYSGNDWYANEVTAGAVRYAANKYNDGTYGITSTLIYGIEWDAIMRWISLDNTLKQYITDSSTIGNNSNTLQTTGSNNSYSLKNIYDLAGNAQEITMETYDDGDYYNKVTRGGGSGYSAFISDRRYGDWDNKGFRAALYL